MLPQNNIFRSERADWYDAALEAKQLATFPEKKVSRNVTNRTTDGHRMAGGGAASSTQQSA
jgi:hypothetical protein